MVTISAVEIPDRQQRERTPRWHRIATLRGATVLCALGLAIQVNTYELFKPNSTALVQILFLLGLLIAFVPCTAVLLRRSVSRNARVITALLLAETLFISRWLVHPLLPANYDELLHLTSLWQLVDGRHFFTPNALIPISPYYPVLELFTAGVHWVTGLSGLPSELLVVMGARGLLVVAFFLVVERVSHSDRVAGLAVALYMTNPQFYSFDAQFAYETLALALAMIALHYTLLAVDGSGVRSRFGIAAACALALLAITHHVTSWAMLLALVSVAVWLGAVGKRSAARVFVVVACIDLVVVGVWSAFVGGRITGYIGPIADEAADSLKAILLRRAQPRAFFVQASGVRTADWEVALIVVSLLAWVCLLLAATFSSSGRRLLRENRALWLVVAGSAGYSLTLVSHVSASAAPFGNRAASFTFFFVATLIALWWISSGRLDRPRYGAISLVVLAAVAVGGVLIGTSPDYQRVPGRYLVEADQRSIDSQAMAAADWAKAHLPQDTRIAADRDDSALMAAVGHLTPVTHRDGSVNVGPLYFAATIGPAQKAMIRRGQIRLLLVDSRWTTSPPYLGYYFEKPVQTAQTFQRLTPEELNKFADWSGARRIYHSGPISIYDLSAFRGLRPITVSSIPAPAGDIGTMNWLIFGEFLAVGAYLLLTKPRDSRSSRDVIALALHVGFAAVIVFTIIAALLVVTNWPADLVGLLLVVPVIVLIKGRRLRSIGDLPRLDRSMVASGLIAAVLLGESIALAIATAAR
jgi:hypothetical protein